MNVPRPTPSYVNNMARLNYYPPPKPKPPIQEKWRSDEVKMLQHLPTTKPPVKVKIPVQQPRSQPTLTPFSPDLLRTGYENEKGRLFFPVVIGGNTRTGKTWMARLKIMQGLKERRWDNIIVICPSNTSSGDYDFLLDKNLQMQYGFVAMIIEDIDSDGVKDKKEFAKSEKLFRKLYASCAERHNAYGLNYLLVLDDVGGSVKKTSTFFGKLATRWYHIGIELWYLCHKLVDLPDKIRDQAQYYFITQLNDLNIEYLWRNVQNGFRDKAEFKDFMRQTMSGQYNICRFDRNCGRLNNCRVFKCPASFN